MKWMNDLDDALINAARRVAVNAKVPAGFTDDEWFNRTERIFEMVDNFKFTQSIQQHVNKVDTLDELQAELDADLYSYRQELFEFVNDFIPEV